MPFAMIYHRRLRRNSLLTWQQRRRIFLRTTIIYTVVFFILGIIFMALYLSQQSYLNQFTCQEICVEYGTLIPCGHQLCCDLPDSEGYYLETTFMFCLQDYVGVLYLIVMSVCLAYAGYQGLLIVFFVCTSQILQSGVTSTAIQPTNSQNRGLASNAYDPYQQYQQQPAFNQPRSNQPYPTQAKTFKVQRQQPPKAKEPTQSLAAEERKAPAEVQSLSKDDPNPNIDDKQL